MTIAFHSNNFNEKLQERKDLSYIKDNAPCVLPKPQSGWDDFRNFSFPNPVPQIDFFTPQAEEKKAPEISGIRVFFNRYTDEQIAQVNEAGQLPKNAKVVDDVNFGKPRLTWNLWDITPGTHKLPAGYELKKDILGFTHLVREGTQAWYLKK